ncbi:MAG: response regulator [Pseudomonadota bacterium]
MARILLAEDESGVREFGIRALEGAGHSVTAVADGQRALEALAGSEFDLLVTDIVMPELDGIALALKAAKERPRMKILLMTGYAHERQRAHNLEALIHKVISKPFSLAELIAAVDTALASAGQGG